MTSPTKQPTQSVIVNDDISPYPNYDPTAVYIVSGIVLGVIGLIAGGCYYLGVCDNTGSADILPQ